MSRTRLLIVIMLLLSFLSASGCTGTSDTDDAPEQPDSPEPIPEGPEAEEEVEKGTGGNALASEPETVNSETTGQIQTLTVNITAEDQEYPAYISAPAEDGEYPAVVLIHSFNGLEQGYQDMADRLAADGFVVVSPQWQTYSRSPSDSGVEALVRSSINYLKNRDDVDPEKLGLTGFCAGGRYTMLFLPQVEEFKSGVAWYGFPYSGGTEVQPDEPASMIDQLEDPMLIIHGTRDEPSNISEIYRYAGELDAADKYFELKVYQGEPHGFMIKEGELSESFVAQDAYDEMVDFFNRTLSNPAPGNSSR
ncbi:dienelactone hydrolase family protein [Methanosarcina mazei]|uniref:dienelactone hydrolase family protein n=1 Tax=Methanosarcina mazei TaxID=2209 RepID=UPI00064FA716|nr:dienelactone hydrolase family protein [Methanosarcina mazei]